MYVYEYIYSIYVVYTNQARLKGISVYFKFLKISSATMELSMKVPHPPKLKLERSWNPVDHSREYIQRNLSHIPQRCLHMVLTELLCATVRLKGQFSCPPRDE